MADEGTIGPADASNAPKNASEGAPVPTGAPSSVPQQSALPTQAPPVIPSAAVPPAAPAQDAPASTPIEPAQKTPGPVTPSAPSGGTDFAKILKEVKLPERREFQAAADTPAPQTPPAQPPTAAAPTKIASEQIVPEQKKGDGKITSVRTLKQDLQDVVKDQKISLVHAATLEQERRHAPKEAPLAVPKAPSHIRGIVFTILILLGLGAAALGGVYFAMQGTISDTPPASTGLVFAEQTFSFSLDGQTPTALKTALSQARTASNATLGSISHIVPTLVENAGETAQIRAASFAEFMEALGTRIPAELVRALDSQFFFGIHTVDENAPLIVVPVNSYDRAFAGMLVWEKTMNADLAPLFAAVPALALGQDGIPTERIFEDVVMRNYDVRALRDDSGAIQLYYSFPTRDILIIAESPYTFTELLSRLQAERRL